MACSGSSARGRVGQGASEGVPPPLSATTERPVAFLPCTPPVCAQEMKDANLYLSRNR